MSSLVSRADKPPAIMYRQIEINWINVPRASSDYLALYLDGEPESGQQLPVSVYRLNNRTHGKLTSDFYLPQIDFYAETNEFASRYPNEFELIVNNKHNNTTTSNTSPVAVKKSLNRECIGYCVAYHSDASILAKSCLTSNPNWMLDSFEALAPRSLPWIMLPGTHNSATYARQLDSSVFQIINKYQMNQDENIFSQLVHGIRHLDLRVGYSKVKHRNERLWIYHDIFRTDVSAGEVFEQVRRFLDLTSHEVIVMDFHRFTVGFSDENAEVQRERHAKLIELIHEQLGKYIVPSYLGIATPIGELVALGKRLVVGYAGRNAILIGHKLDQLKSSSSVSVIRDIDAAKQDQEDLSFNLGLNSSDPASMMQMNQQQIDRRVGTRIFNKLKLLKIVRKSFSKRSLGASGEQQQQQQLPNSGDIGSSLAKVALFFPSVRHLWPNKDTLEGLAAYMNESACKRHFGELRSMMVELTPTVFGVISDKYDGNRKLASLVNRPVSDWIRDRWLHCINIVASDFFLGNNLVALAIYANRMRALGNANLSNPNSDNNSSSNGLDGGGQCRSFRRIGHLLDKSKIPIQLVYDFQSSSHLGDADDEADMMPYYPRSNRATSSEANESVIHTSSDGSRVHLRLLTNADQSIRGDKRDSFVDNIADGFVNVLSSLRRLFAS